MKKLAIALLAIVFLSPISACAADKDKPKEQPKQEQVQSEKKVSKEATLKDLETQKAVLMLRLEGAKAVQKSVDAIVDNGMVELELLNRAIAEKTPKKDERK